MASNDFDVFIKKLEAFENAGAKIAEKVAPEIQDLVKLEFALGSDPYDRPWRPLAPATRAHGRTPPPLTDTGEMRGSVSAKPEGAAVRVHVDGPAVHHQYGTQSMPARKILPEGKLPRTWLTAIQVAFTDVIHAD